MAFIRFSDIYGGQPMEATVCQEHLSGGWVPVQPWISPEAVPDTRTCAQAVNLGDDSRK